MNRSLRRQRLKEPKEKPGGRASVRPAPRAAGQTAGGSARGAARGGGAFWRPRIVTDVISELRKVVWPTREEVVYLTIVVVVVTLILGAVLGAIDIAFGWLIDRTLLS
jgi:preprotein translocase subunit SecE